VRRSAPVLSLAVSLAFLVLTVVATIAASSRGNCGDGHYRPPCSMFALGIVIYGLVAVGAVATLITLVALILRQRVPPLLKASSVLYVAALLSLAVPVLAAGNKLAGAIVVLGVFPLSLGLLAAASVCLILWLGQAMSRKLGYDSSSIAVS
jgi:hypothetical protein